MTALLTTLDVAERYREVRSQTELSANPLGPEDQTVQSMPDVSPTKWHRAHTTWFFETFVLCEYLTDYAIFDAGFDYLFNSYYETVGPRYPRDQRGNISRPGIADIGYYRQYVDSAMEALFSNGLTDACAELVELGIHHEQQHQELIMMDIKHVFSLNPLEPKYHLISPPGPSHSTTTAITWIPNEGGLVDVGADDSEFTFDNERPKHRVWLDPYEVAHRTVTCGEWKEFIDDGGYERPELWLSEGWGIVGAQGWDSPLYWTEHDRNWSIFTLHGSRPVLDAEPVCHVSHFEADAFARWAGARLPTEHEWEWIVSSSGLIPTDSDNLGDHRANHPLPVANTRSATEQIQAAFGDVWEWTSSPYVGFPDYAPPEGATGEYNGKFMSNQMVLRGGCCVTPAGHIRATYRNFFPPASRWQFGGLRLARSVAAT